MFVSLESKILLLQQVATIFIINSIIIFINYSKNLTLTLGDIHKTHLVPVTKITSERFASTKKQIYSRHIFVWI